MASPTLTVKGEKFVLIPKKEYDQLQALRARQMRQDQGDIAEARRRAREPSIPLEQARKRLGT
jgi:hypothetical protein